MKYYISADYGHGRDYACVVVAEKAKDAIYVIGEGWHLNSEKIARRIAISTIRPWWKRWLVMWRERYEQRQGS